MTKKSHTSSVNTDIILTLEIANSSFGLNLHNFQSIEDSAAGALGKLKQSGFTNLSE